METMTTNLSYGLIEFTGVTVLWVLFVTYNLTTRVTPYVNPVNYTDSVKSASSVDNTSSQEVICEVLLENPENNYQEAISDVTSEIPLVNSETVTSIREPHVDISRILIEGVRVFQETLQKMFPDFNFNFSLDYVGGLDVISQRFLNICAIFFQEYPLNTLTDRNINDLIQNSLVEVYKYASSEALLLAMQTSLHGQMFLPDILIGANSGLFLFIQVVNLIYLNLHQLDPNVRLVSIDILSDTFYIKLGELRKYLPTLNDM